ncbi:MAG TPA: large conductance mechanosensitive channel protein MscL [Thermotogota bacterium]|nr:large conductance mechanosensitive channel protein MscL [Thermotogota bacterium]HRW93666.1 large conductance mechanosensitive channel protein MscL [Thermotogota bacterium]
MWKEFKKFISRGNVVDLAIGIIIGTAFTGIVRSLVNDVIMPPIGMLLGRVDFTNLFVALDGQKYESLAAATEAGAATLNYGVFINTVINFLIVAFVIFLVVRQLNKMKEKPAPPAPAPTTKECPYCKSQIPLQATRCPNCTSQLGN